MAEVDLWSVPREAGGCSVVELRGLTVRAADGVVGVVDSGCARAGGSYLLVSSAPSLGTTTAMVPAGMIDHVDLDLGIVHLGCSRAAVASAPRFEGDRYRDGAYRAELGLHYGARPTRAGGAPLVP